MSWNAENRTISFTRGNERVECVYDYMGRRVRKTMYRDDEVVSRRVFVYNGYRLVAELNDMEETYGEAVSKTWLWDPTGVFDNSPLEMQVWKEEEEYPTEDSSSSESTTEYPTTAYPEEESSSSQETTEYPTMDDPRGNSSDNSALTSNGESVERSAWQQSRLLNMGLSSSPSLVENRKRYYYMNDGNRNIIALRTAEEGICATYSYGTYGHRLKTTGSQTGRNPFCFSSEYYDGELGLIYYNYRHYNPMDGHWLSRDPKGESGGTNLYGFCGNNPASQVDNLGLISLPGASSTGLSTHWGNIVREKRHWAKVCYKYYKGPSKVTEATPIWEELAKANRLNYVDKSKWVKGYKPLPEPGDVFEVPNLFFIYIARRDNIEPEDLVYHGVIDFYKKKFWQARVAGELRDDNIVSLSRRKVEMLQNKLERQGVKVWSTEDWSSKIFKIGWLLDGVFGVAFAGHGSQDEDGKWCGFNAEGVRRTNIVIPAEVQTNYKMSYIAAYTCGGKEAGWEIHLSEYGILEGYSGRASYITES